MKNYKTIILLTLLSMGISIGAKAQDSMSIKIHSAYLNLNSTSNSFQVIYTLKAFDTVYFDSSAIKLNKPRVSEVGLGNETNSFFTINYQNGLPDVLYPGDSLTNTATVNFNFNKRPFYVQTLHFELVHLTDSSTISSIVGKVYVHFTKDEKLEIFNEQEFENQIRVWNMDRANDTLVIDYFDTSYVPVSDLTLAEFYNDSIPKTYFSFDHLSYLVPMHEVEDTFDRDYLAPGAIQRRADGCNRPGRKRWKGIIKGNLKALVELDGSPGNTSINLQGIRVKIREKDKWPNPDETLATVYTDADGNFSVWVEECQSDFWEGNNLELYLQIESQNESESIKVRHKYFQGKKIVTAHHSNPVSWHYNNGNTIDEVDFGTIWPSTDKSQAQLLHWANQARDFVNGSDGVGHGFTIGSKVRPLLIQEFLGLWTDGGGMFISETYLSKGDRIYLGHNDVLDEDLLWHEFGHYLMYRLQNESWSECAKWGSHSSVTNAKTKHLAWTEGWAEGFSQIVDVVHKSNDNEAGFWYEEIGKRWGNDWESEFETTNNGNMHLWTHGMTNEQCIGSFILDVFDGETNFRSTNSDDGLPGPIWGGRDDIQMSFSDICTPIRLNKGNGGSASTYTLNSMDEYVHSLSRNLACDEVSKLQECVVANKLSTPMNNNTTFSTLSTDVICRSINVSWNTFKYKWGKKKFKYKGSTSDAFYFDVNTLSGTNDDYNLVGYKYTESWYTVDQRDIVLTDPLTITDGATLFANADANFGFMNYSQSWHSGKFRVSALIEDELIVRLGNGRTNVNDGGRIEIGSYKKVDAFVCGGTTLSAGESINNSSKSIIKVHDNSTLTIDEGAILHLFPNYQIILDGPNAILHIKGDVVLEDNTDFEVFGGPNGKGYVIWESNYISPNDQSAHLITGTNCNVKFSQNGWGVKALECRGNMGFQTPWTLNNLEIRHCTVQLMEESQIESLADNTMVEDVIIRGHLSSHVNPNLNWKLNSRGFKQLGRRNSFKKVRFIECTEGITIFNNGTSAPLKLEDVEFLSCNIGIRNWAGRIHWNGGSIKQNYIDMGAADVNTLIGVKGIGGQSVSLFNNVEMLARDNNSPINPFTTESTYNMHLHGSGRYQIYKSKLYDADYGIYSNQEHIHSWCSEYKDNVRQLTLHQETVLGLGPRRWNTIHFTGALGSDHRVIYGLHSLRLLLNNGANRFLGPDGSPGLSAYISASLDPTQTYVPSTIGSNTNALMGAGNEWLSSPNPGTGLIYFPDPMFNSFLTDPGWNQAFDINHNPAYSPAPGAVWEMEKNAFCNNYKTPLGVPSGNGWMPLGGGFVDETHARYGTGSSMNSYDVKTIFLQNGNPDANAVKNLMHDLYQTSSVNPINYQNLINQGMQLSLIDFPNEIAWVNYDLYKLVQDIYPELHTDPFYSDVAIAQMEPLMYHQLIQWSNGLMMKANESTSNWRHFKFELVRDRALIHRNFGHRQEALNWLNQEIPNFTKPQDIAELHNWHCIIATEQEYLDNNITLDQLFEYGCLSHLVNENLNQALIWDPTDFFSVLDGDGFIKEEEEDGTPEPEHNNATIISLDEGLSVYPNPSSSLFNYRNPQLKAISNIKVYSANGILIRTIQNPDKEGSIDLSSNSNGVYMITFELPNRTIQTKVILMR